MAPDPIDGAGDAGVLKKRPQIPDDVRKTVVDAYYRSAFAAPEAARNRAQAAYTIASAVAAALIAAGAFADFPERPTWEKVFGALSLAVWVLAAFLFMYAVATPYRDPDSGKSVIGAQEFIKHVGANTRAERNLIVERQRRAMWAVVVAALLTGLTTGIGLFSTPTKLRTAIVLLTPKGIRQLGAPCNGRASIRGVVDTSTIASPVVVIQVKAGMCGPGKGELNVPAAEVAAVLVA
jgi:hypothetical protein